MVDKHNMSWCDESMQIVYIRLKAAEDHYTLTNDENGFEVL